MKLAYLTATGQLARDAYRHRITGVEQRWEERFGERPVRALRVSLDELIGDGTAADPPLFAGLDPGTSGWRASLPRPDTLPHYPMVTHRGAFPDGS
ncbi:MAG: hypothetical protein ACR2NR_21215 [Solirubrobacteraceae bacterium]